MTYPEALKFMYAQLPFFQKAGEKAYHPGFDNILRLCDILGNPHQKIKTIHIAGTNGKGSTAHMLAAILQMAGYKTGLYTSPHLKEFTERIKIDGKEAPQAFIADWVAQYQSLIEEIQPSFFEVTVAMAFDYFAQQQVDIAVVETGLGGRLDATNIITPEVGLITNIGWDHMHILGDTLPKIAVEKAGIIKPHVPVVISEYQAEVEEVFRQKATKENAPIYFASEVFELEESFKGIEVRRKDNDEFTLRQLSLLGAHQLKNLAGVLQTIYLLKGKGFEVKSQHMVSALSKVQSITGLKGRWQVLGQKPLIICDVAHNEDGLRYVLAEIKKQSYETLHVVFGMLQEKQPNKILSLLPKEARYYLCEADNDRAYNVLELASRARHFHLQYEVCESVAQAFEQAKKNAQPEDMIFVGGSTFVVAEVV